MAARRMGGGLAAVLLAVLSACSSHHSVLRSELQSQPVATRSSMSQALDCVGERLQQVPYSKAYVFQVGDIGDATVNLNAMAGDSLANAGKLQLQHAIATRLGRFNGVVIGSDSYSSAVQGSGLPQGSRRQSGRQATAGSSLTPLYSRLVSSERRKLGLSGEVALQPVYISGSYARHDSSYPDQRGNGYSVRRDSDDGSVQQESLGYGHSRAESGMTLIINIIDPRYNLILHSHSFDLTYHYASQSFTLGFGQGSMQYGFARSTVTIESAHAAQQTLMDAAAGWVLTTLFSDAEFNRQCGI